MSAHPDACHSASPKISRPLPYDPIPNTILNTLRCPLCEHRMTQDATRLSCTGGHSFDRAKQGYVTLRTGDRTPLNADTPQMVMARETLLDTGIYEPIRSRAARLIATEVASGEAPFIADLAGGTGYYLAGILERMPASLGVCIDLSAAALKRAARCHPRATAIGADLRRRLPLADESVSVVTSFFGPRNVSEIRRVMRTNGILAVVTPTADHLVDLVEPLGMLRVDEHKDARLHTSLKSFSLLREERIEYRETLTPQQVRSLVGMGPSAHHVTTEQLRARMDRLSDDAVTTVSVNLRIYGRAKHRLRS